MEGVSKRYGGVRALANADLTVFSGRIHAILGENGAGKSTLIKILSGVVAPDAGRIVLDGAEVAFDSPAAANRAGIVCIFQELSLVPDLSVADNIAISNPPRRFGLIDRRASRASSFSTRRHRRSPPPMSARCSSSSSACARKGWRFCTFPTACTR
jgi:ribose transport system ATP-binding protein